jgi:branched-chain amino acid transport system substrate-binding protein
MRKLIAILVIVLVIIAGIIIWYLIKPKPVPVLVAKEIKVGAIINLTGPASTWGQFHAKGHKDYFRYVNEEKGGIKGNRINLTIVDHAYKVQEAVNYVKRFCTEDKMDMIATWDTGSGIQAKPIIQEYKIPNINYSTYQGILSDPVAYAYLPFGSYVMDSYAVLEYIKAIHKGDAPPKVGLLTYNNPYGKSIHAASTEYAANNGINIVAIEEFPNTALDLNTEILRLQKKKAEYIFMQCLPSAIILALKAADQANYDVPFFGTWTSTDPDFFERGKGLIRDRMHMQFPGCLPGDGSPGIKLLETLWEKYQTVSKFDCSYWEGVVIASIMERAFTKALDQFGEINSQTINQALETFRNEDFGGLMPNITYTETDHGASWTARIIRINEDQTFTPLTTFWEPGKEKIQLVTGSD